MRYSSGILKPDCLSRGLVDTVFSIIEEAGLNVVFYKKISLSIDNIKVLYAHCLGTWYFEGMSQFLLSSEVIFYVVQGNGNNVRKNLDDVVGHTDPKLSASGTIRSLGLDIRHNLIHSTATIETFWSEVNLFLTKQEMQKIGLAR